MGWISLAIDTYYVLTPRSTTLPFGLSTHNTILLPRRSREMKRDETPDEMKRRDEMKTEEMR
jgi:hypothetical protein